MFPVGDNVNILPIFLGLKAMLCKWTFTKRFSTLPTPQRKCLTLRQKSQKMRCLGSSGVPMQNGAHGKV